MESFLKMLGWSPWPVKCKKQLKVDIRQACSSHCNFDNRGTAMLSSWKIVLAKLMITLASETQDRSQPFTSFKYSRVHHVFKCISKVGFAGFWKQGHKGLVKKPAPCYHFVCGIYVHWLAVASLTMDVVSSRKDWDWYLQNEMFSLLSPCL